MMYFKSTLAVLLVSCMFFNTAQAGKYDLSKVLSEPLKINVCTNYINEGGMFAQTNANFPSYIQIQGELRNYGTAVKDCTGDDIPCTQSNVTFVFLKSLDTKLDSVRLCYEGTDKKGQVNLTPIKDHVISTTSSLVQGTKTATYMAKAPVMTSGIAALMLCQCAVGEDSGATSVEYSSGTLEFHNPHGYLSGSLYGYLPFYTLMTGCYVLLLAAYTLMYYKYRDHVLGLQKFIIFVICMGLVENFSWYLNYESMNSSGEPQCCPIRKGILVSIVIQNAKKCVSAVLVLCVCLGLGVVLPTLDKSQKFKVGALAIAYYASAVLHDFERIETIEERSATGQASVSVYGAFLVAVCDLLFIFWINLALSNIMQELLEQRQVAKLGMYQSLARTLYSFVILWVIYTITQIAINKHVVQISWQHEYLLWAFWDVLYFAILVVISYIWAPSETASQYAFSMQLPTEDLDSDEFENQLEMNAPDTADQHFEIGDADFDDDDDFEQEIEMIIKSPSRVESKGSENKASLSTT